MSELTKTRVKTKTGEVNMDELRKRFEPLADFSRMVNSAAETTKVLTNTNVSEHSTDNGAPSNGPTSNRLSTPKLSRRVASAETDYRLTKSIPNDQSEEPLPRGLPVRLSPIAALPNGPIKRFLGSKGRSLSDTSKMYRGSIDSGLEVPDSPTIVKKTGRLTADDTDAAGLRRNPYSSSIKRRPLRRRQSKRLDKPEEKSYGNDTESYEAIRERVLQEKAVVNAIEALQERWRMIMFMYSDAVDMNNDRIQRQQMKLTVKRQEELVILVALFLMFCLPVMILFFLLCRNL